MSHYRRSRWVARLYIHVGCKIIFPTFPPPPRTAHLAWKTTALSLYTDFIFHRVGGPAVVALPSMCPSRLYCVCGMRGGQMSSDPMV
jgi:hypothetical protein